MKGWFDGGIKMSDLRIIFEHECECGYISQIDTDKCDKYICPKCGAVVFEKVEDAFEHAKGKVKI